MFLATEKSRRFMPCAILLFACLSLACDASSAFSQEKRTPSDIAPTVNYSSENPDWLAFIGNGSKSNAGSWWPSWKFPSWPTPKSTKSGAGWWNSGKSGSSYSKNNKTTMQKVSQTSKRWWNNTLEFLDPYAPPKERPATARSNPGFFGKLFGGGEPAPQFNSVPEWASQPMLK
jgi:hypothetical protein